MLTQPYVLFFAPLVCPGCRQECACALWWHFRSHQRGTFLSLKVQFSLKLWTHRLCPADGHSCWLQLSGSPNHTAVEPIAGRQTTHSLSVHGHSGEIYIFYIYHLLKTGLVEQNRKCEPHVTSGIPLSVWNCDSKKHVSCNLKRQVTLVSESDITVSCVNKENGKQTQNRWTRQPGAKIRIIRGCRLCCVGGTEWGGERSFQQLVL